MSKISIGIVGYGNLGKGVEMAVSQNKDLELFGVFTRRNPKDVSSKAAVYSYSDIANFKNKIDVMILCGGSATDLPKQSIEVSKHFNTVDSFDNHAKIPAYFEAVNKQAEKNNTLSLISTGWDPGLFSVMRLLGETVLPQGKTYTFWGKGLSQGHSDAIRRIEGVKYGAQYTLPKEESLAQIRKGKQPAFEASKIHNRLCYVVLEEDANAEKIEQEIKTMPNYFAPYHTEVHFIEENEFKENHQKMPHGGKVIRSGYSKAENYQHFEFSLALQSNPEFTSSVLTTFARAVYKMHQQGKTGAVSIFDIPLGALSTESAATLRKRLL